MECTLKTRLSSVNSGLVFQLSCWGITCWVQCYVHFEAQHLGSWRNQVGLGLLTKRFETGHWPDNC
jgi:hypothetical protein